MADSFFDAIDSAAIGSGRNYFCPGRFKVRIERIAKKDAKDSQQGKTSFIVEAYVLESDAPALPAGVAASWVQTVKPGDTIANQRQQALALASIKQFFAALLKDPKLESASASEILALATSEANPFAGQVVGLVCKGKPMKDGGVFTVHTWFPVDA